MIEVTDEPKTTSVFVLEKTMVLVKIMKISFFNGRSIAVVCLLTLFLFAGAVNAGQPLVIAGTGDSQALLYMLAGQLMKRHPEYQIEIPDSIGSGGGIKGLLQKRFELVRTARPLKAKEQDGTLVENPFALSPIAFCTHPSVTGVDNLTSTQVIGIYTGVIANWKQVGGQPAPIYPVDREAGDSSRTILERNMENFKAARSVAKIFYSTPEAAEAIAGHKYTIGFLPLGLARSLYLNILSIDGVSPGRDSLRNGQYPYFSIFYLVSHVGCSKTAKAFVDYVYSPEAVEIIKEHGLVPMARAHP
ncbi:phosphate-binding protein [Desulfosarcina ovata subsp. sediminis]|uniref:Phosphate-binding protein n=1 Tax=Desulfosarcina ovata subsp. sediminis TaxID=885957 RepID=A0A5K7ZQU5_9BACT|nr:substrate-binding domain-containing protein [Desulfosarcina ovata]BBO82310.1 phosphate-binding protein [Desulfosarcina ovata subsp. sediminis]